MDRLEYIWKDRKRVMGMPITFTRYAMNEDRMFLETGFFSTKQDEIILYRIRDISLRISLWQRIFGVGTIFVTSSDKSLPELEIKNVKHPRDVKELIHKQVEEMKIKRRVRVGEILEGNPFGHDHDDDLDDDMLDDDE